MAVASDPVARRGPAPAVARLRQTLLAALALSLLLFYRSGRLPTDLHVYVLGGHAVLHGENLYGPAVAVQGYPFTYPPFAALPFALLAALPTWLIIAVTCALFYGLLAVVVHCCAPGLLARTGRSWTAWLTMLVVLAFNPDWATLHDGQVNVALEALVVLDLLRVHRGRGWLIGVAAAVKLTPAVFVGYLLVTRQWAAARNAVLGIVACTGLAWAVLPSDSHRFWTHTLFQTSRIGDIARVSNQSLSGLAHKELAGTAIDITWVLSGLLAAAVALWTAQRLRTLGHEVLAIGVVGVLGCLLSPISWTHHWVWVVPLFLGVLATSAWRRRDVRIATVIACAVFITGASRPAPDVPVVHLVLANLYTLLGIAIVLVTAWALRRSMPRRSG